MRYCSSCRPASGGATALTLTLALALTLAPTLAQVELVFPPDFPEAPPYVRFTTDMFHPHISPSGVPYLRTLLMWHCCEPKVPKPSPSL